MTAVLLHGNPETPVIWQPLLEHLQRTDVVCPQLPGFGIPAPEGFGATKEEYADWIGDELEHLVAQSGPVDLVGHDWGGGFAMMVVATRPELVRSWACDVLGLFHPDYVWHDFAQIWRTPGAGEEFFEQSLASPVEDRVALYESVGIPRATGEQIVAAFDEETARCVLALYRSADESELAAIGQRLGPAADRPGLAVIAPDDPFVRDVDYARQIAERLGARVHELAGQGHWWMLGDPAGGARMLDEFWASL